MVAYGNHNVNSDVYDEHGAYEITSGPQKRLKMFTDIDMNNQRILNSPGPI